MLSSVACISALCVLTRYAVSKPAPPEFLAPLAPDKYAGPERTLSAIISARI